MQKKKIHVPIVQVLGSEKAPEKTSVIPSEESQHANGGPHWWFIQSKWSLDIILQTIATISVCYIRDLKEGRRTWWRSPDRRCWWGTVNV